MFKSASLKLTALYVIILGVICLFFSLNLYYVSTRELERGLQGQIERINNRRPGRLLPKELERSDIDEALIGGRGRIVGRLIIANAIIITVGGVGSYFLARRTLKPIEDAHEAQTRFTADASHELRTPLATMQTEIEVALNQPKLTAKEAKEILTSNLQEVRELSELTHSLLRLSRLDEPIQKRLTELNEPTNRAISRVQKMAEQKEIKINKIGNFDITLSADTTGITTILGVLLDNAIHHSPKGAQINVLANLTRQYVVIAVQDNGTGISPSDMPHIFDRFYQASSSRTTGSNHRYGLGLSLAKQLAQRMNGTLSVSSKLGQGSTFSLKLPS